MSKKIKSITNLSTYADDQFHNIATWKNADIIQNHLNRDMAWRDLILNDAEWMHMETEWEVLLEENTFDGKPVFDRSFMRKEYSNPIEAFVGQIKMGFYPPPEIMLIIADSLKIYFESNGSKELSEILFPKSRQKLGNFSAQMHKNKKFANFHSLYTRQEKISLEKFAESYFHCKSYTLFGFTEELYEHLGIENKAIVNENYDPDLDIDNFLREYRRWKKKI